MLPKCLDFWPGGADKTGFGSRQIEAGSKAVFQAQIEGYKEKTENAQKAQNNVFFALHHHNISGIIKIEIYAFFGLFGASP
jgi:hypothetical protein